MENEHKKLILDNLDALITSIDYEILKKELQFEDILSRKMIENIENVRVFLHINV